MTVHRVLKALFPSVFSESGFACNSKKGKMHVVIFCEICERMMWATVNLYYIAPSHQILKSVLSFSRFWDTMSIFPVHSIVFWWFSSKGWDASWHSQCSTIKRNSPTFIFLMELSPPLAQPPLSHHNHHYHPPLPPPPRSQPPQLTKASFSHLPLQFLRDLSHESFVFTSSTFIFWVNSRTKASFSHLSTFSSNCSFRKHLSPAMSCTCLLLILDEQRAPRNTDFQRAMGQPLADGGYDELCVFPHLPVEGC